MPNPPVAKQMRVRERLLTLGAQKLSDTELLAILISSGSGRKSCIQLAIDLLNHFGDLRAILNAAPQAFQSIHGLGMVRYVQLQAAREICRRSDFIQLQKHCVLNNTLQTCAYLKRRLRDKKNETVAALFLDSQYHIIAYEELFTGTINSATIHLRPIIERILNLNAAALILAHNHPSGLANESPEDRIVTSRLREALTLIDVKLLDHLVIGDNEIYSIMSTQKWPCH
jgi:DNA repair protein RadC